jgi:hypothetical protein
MGGLPCAKAVIDNGYGLIQKLSCMNASILLNFEQTQPTYEQMNEFIARANHLAEYAAGIQEYVSKGTELDSDYKEEKQKKKGKG